MSNGAGAHARHLKHRQAKLDHHWPAADGVTWRQRASFAEAEARRVAAHIFVLTGRRYEVYECRWEGCGAWHIRLRGGWRQSLARPA